MPKRAETAFETKLRGALTPYPVKESHLVGVSGGRDSVALLNGLLGSGFLDLTVCHLDHGLRGEESREDAAFVRRLAEEHGLRVEVGETDVRTLAKTKKLSLETAAREARYRFFAQVAERHQCRTLFLAHHADDQAETFLFNLLRGAGPAGLSGMRPATTRRVGATVLELVRPLLAVWREEIDDYLVTTKITWREDATNADPAFGTRNRLRAEALPMLAHVMGRGVKPALWRAAELLGAEQDWLDELDFGQPAPPEKLSVKELRAQPLAQQRRTVRRWLLGHRIAGVGFREVEAALSLLEAASGPAKVNLPGGCHVRRRGGLMFIEPAPSTD